MQRLSDREIDVRLQTLRDWEREGGAIRRTFRFSGFRDAIAFVNAVAELAEAADHHPDILVHGYNKVTLTLTTHDAGGLTQRDFLLAAQIEHT